MYREKSQDWNEQKSTAIKFLSKNLSGKGEILGKYGSRGKLRKCKKKPEVKFVRGRGKILGAYGSRGKLRKCDVDQSQ